MYFKATNFRGMNFSGIVILWFLKNIEDFAVF